MKMLEASLSISNPTLVRQLQPGLPKVQIVRMIENAGVKGLIDPIIRLYSWRNGIVHGRAIAELERGFFPKETYVLRELEDAILDMEFFREGAENHPEMLEAVGRYFPTFWNQNTKWLAVDLQPSRNNRVMLIDTMANEPFREAYVSFDCFMADMIRANKENIGLKCFNVN